MCGHLGVWLKKPDSRIIPLLAGLAVTMDCRGGDSWGYWADGNLVKGLGTFTSKNQARNFGGIKTFMGHTRAASVGAKTVENSHPFHIGHTIGAHNGSISNWFDLNKEYERKFEVDSMHIFAHIDEYGYDRLDELSGYGAIAWLDDRAPEIINLARWNGGQLAIAEIYTKDGQVLGTAYASTVEALAPSLEIAGFKYKLFKVDEKKLYFTQNCEIRVDQKSKLAFGERGKYFLPSKSYSHKRPDGWWEDGVYRSFADSNTDNFKKQKSKVVYVNEISPELQNRLEAMGIKVEKTSNENYKIVRENPIASGSSSTGFANNVHTQRRKCWTCDKPNVDTVRHDILGAPLCFVCTMNLEDEFLDTESQTEASEVDEITKEFERRMSIEIFKDETQVPDHIMKWLETGEGDTVTLPSRDTAGVE